MRRIVLALFSLCTVAGCGDPEVLVHLSAASDIETPDQICLSFFGGERSAQLRESICLEAFSLPQTFIVAPGAATAGKLVRIHAEGFSGITPVGAGDATTVLPEDGRSDDEPSVTLVKTCAGVICPRLQSCVAETGECDRACLDRAGCENFVGCEDLTCPGGGGTSLGTCTGTAADADLDTYGDVLCQLDEGDDLDDTTWDITTLAAKEDEPVCGSARDFNADDKTDELQLCDSNCTPDVAMGATIAQADGGTIRGSFGEVTDVAGVRETSDGARFFVFATDSSIASYTEDATKISSLETPAVNQLVMQGRLLAAATDEGLVLAEISTDGVLTAIAQPIAIPPTGGAVLWAVLLAEDTVWVSGERVDGERVGLAAVDVSNISSPRYLGGVRGSRAKSLARLQDGVLAALPDPAADGGYLAFYTAIARAAPEIPIGENVMDEKGLLVTRPVLALAARPGRSTKLPTACCDATPSCDPLCDEDETLAISFESLARIYTREGAGFTQSDTVDESGISVMQLDEGVFTFISLGGEIFAYIRDPLRRGRILAAYDTIPRLGENCSGDGCSAFWGSTTDTGAPFVAAGIGQTIRYAVFECTY